MISGESAPANKILPPMSPDRAHDYFMGFSNDFLYKGGAWAECRSRRSRGLKFAQFATARQILHIGFKDFVDAIQAASWTAPEQVDILTKEIVHERAQRYERFQLLTSEQLPLEDTLTTELAIFSNEELPDHISASSQTVKDFFVREFSERLQTDMAQFIAFIDGKHAVQDAATPKHRAAVWLGVAAACMASGLILDHVAATKSA